MSKWKGMTALLTAALLLGAPMAQPLSASASVHTLYTVSDGDQFSDPLTLTPERVTNGRYAAYFTQNRSDVVLVNLADQSKQVIYTSPSRVVRTIAIADNHVVYSDQQGVYVYDLETGQQKSIGPSGQAGDVLGIYAGKVIFTASNYANFETTDPHVYEYDLQAQKRSDLAGFDQKNASDIGRISGHHLLTRIVGDSSSQLSVFNLREGRGYLVDNLPFLTVAFAADSAGNVYWEQTGSDYRSEIMRYNRVTRASEVLLKEKSAVADFVIDNRDRLLYKVYDSEQDAWHMKLVDPDDAETPLEYIGDMETSYQDFSLSGDLVYFWAEQDHGQSIQLLQEDLTHVETTLPFDGEEADHDHHHHTGIIIQIGSNKAMTYSGDEAADITIDAPPYIENARTMVPLRAVSTSLGADVQWDEATQGITLMKDGHTVSLVIGQQQALVDGGAVPLEVAPVKKGDRTFVPVRFVSEMLGANVQWDGATQTIIIESEMPE